MNGLISILNFSKRKRTFPFIQFKRKSFFLLCIFFKLQIAFKSATLNVFQGHRAIERFFIVRMLRKPALVNH